MTTNKDSRIESLVEAFDQLLDSDGSVDSSRVDSLSDDEILELNRRLFCLQLLDAAKPDNDPRADDVSTLRPTNDDSLREGVELRQYDGALVFDRYTVVRLIGRGGHADVYLARDDELERDVAIKVPRTYDLKNSGQLDRLRREAKAAAILSHPNIVPLFQSKIDEEQAYLVYGYADGPTLAEWLEDRVQTVGQRRVGEATAARIVRTLAEAIQHAHSKGVIHRDLKPANILFWSSVPKPDQVEENQGDSIADLLCISDFGLARLSDHDNYLTQAGDILGTPAYMSPEQARGAAEETDARSDVYALGVILFELLTGQTPFRGDGPFQIIRAIGTEQVTWPQMSLATDLKAIAGKCLEKDPEHRYDNANQLADDLQRFLLGSVVSVRLPTLFERYRRWFRYSPKTAWLTTSLVLSLLIGALSSTFFALRSAGHAEDARENESLWRAAAEKAVENENLWRREANRATASEALVKEEQSKTEQLLNDARYRNYGMAMSEAMRYALTGFKPNAERIVKASPMAFRGVEHDLVYSSSVAPIQQIKPTAVLLSRYQLLRARRLLLIQRAHKDKSKTAIGVYDLQKRNLKTVLEFPARGLNFVADEQLTRIVIFGNNTLSVFEPEGRLVARHEVEQGTTIDKVEFLPKVDSLLIASSRNRYQPILETWDFVKQTDPTTLLEIERAVVDLKFGPFGKKLAVAQFNSLKVVEYPSLKEITTEPFDVPNSLQFSPDGSQILMARAHGEVVGYDLIKRSVTSESMFHDRQAYPRYIPNSDQVCTWTDKGAVRLWDSRHKIVTLQMNMNRSDLYGCEFLDWEKTAICIYPDRITFLDYSRHYPHSTVDLRTPVNQLKVGESGTTLWLATKGFASSESRVVLVDWRTGELQYERPLDAVLGWKSHFLEFPPVVWAGRRPLTRYSLNPEQPTTDVSIKPVDSEESVEGLSISTDGRRLFTVGSKGVVMFSAPLDVNKLESLADLKRTNLSTKFNLADFGTATCIDWYEPAARLACGFSTGQVVVFDLSTDSILYNDRPVDLAQGKTVISHIEFSPSGKDLLVTCSQRRSVVLDAESEFKVRFELNVRGLIARYSPSGKWIAAGDAAPGSKPFVGLFDAANGEEVARFLESVRTVRDVQFSHDERFMFVGSSDYVHPLVVFDLKSK